ncbi:HEAT repeat protein [Caloramator mitchellensis]|uniref:HEAT repeat protein n=1 Tax=Caloramator mitchellensis TaxID=908809 RepID=A0A0R3JW79_CALMK|nr:HEAT repeat domain-containing protein [Caloramator mitchellensis]KRQ87815.1 HEAT repeat protein [Caloramator mitchellensis]
MERFVYISIIFFTIVIFFLYLYLIIEKSLDIYRNRIRRKYEANIIKLTDYIIQRIEEGNLGQKHLNKSKEIVKNKIKREIFEDRLLYYFTLYKGQIVKKLIEFVEEIGLVDIEIKNLESKNLYHVSMTLRKLGEFRCKKAIPYLLDVLKIEVPDIKYNSLLALSKIGDEEAFIEGFNRITAGIPLSERSLIELIDDFEGDKGYVYEKMINSDNDFLSAIFMKSAANYMDFRFSEMAVKYLKDNNKEKRIAAIKLIGNAADVRFIDEVLECLNDAEWEVRAVTAKVLERFEDEKAVIPLVSALSDKVWFVRYNAAKSLIKIPGGIDAIEIVMQGDDKFAKDIVIYAVENLGILNGFAKDVPKEVQEKISGIFEEYRKG